MDPIKKVTGPCVILAGAGTGKTRLMVEKVKNLIEKKIYPAEKIVCITFSNEAANNLSSRIRSAIPDLQSEPIIKTFHSFSSFLLKENLPKEKQNFQILSPDEAKILLHTNLRVTPANCHRYIDTIGKAKDLGISINSLKEYLSKKPHSSLLEKLKENFETLQNELLKEQDKTKKKQLSDELIKIKETLDLARFVPIFDAYEKIKFQRKLLDYSDLNNNAVELLESNPDIANKFNYIIVDEFQDTNRIQLKLLEFLAPHKNITVVGDMNQSIYRFRGAYEANIERFKKVFGVTKSDIFTLEKSYRSTNKILKIAHQLISNNYSPEDECLFVQNAFNNTGENIEIYELKNGKEEARKVVEIIKETNAKNIPLEEICVMARTHQQLAVIRKALANAGIEFHSVGSESLLKQKSIKKVISYLTILRNLTEKNNKGWSAWWELIHEEQLSKQDFVTITEFLKENRDKDNYNVRIFNLLQNLPLSNEGKIKISSLLTGIKTLLSKNRDNLLEIIKDACFVCGFLSEDELIEKEILFNINKFQEFAKKYSETNASRLSDFIDYIEILNILDISIEAPQTEEKGVRLMTSHAAKGLEYHTVILTNMAQKRFPIEKLSTNKLLPEELIKKESHIENQEDYERQNQLFEERRLCYVSFTRSRSKLYLTFAQEYAGKKFAPSQFLEEINFKSNQDINFFQDFEEKYVENKEGANFLENQKNLQIKERILSPSALILFQDCQKKFEYKYIFNMPDKITTSWDAIKLGSFIHLVLEKGVKNNFKKLEEFINLAKDIKSKEEWESLDLEEALPLIKIFYERNKNKYSETSLTEQPLFATFSGLKFMGIADRIDFHPEGIEIIDYKTGKTLPSVKERNIQLGYYALAAKKLGKVKKITLEVLKNPSPMEFSVKENGDIVSLVSNRTVFNLNEIERQLTELGNKIKTAYLEGFKPCPIEKGCEFCDEYIY